MMDARIVNNDVIFLNQLKNIQFNLAKAVEENNLKMIKFWKKELNTFLKTNYGI